MEEKISVLTLLWLGGKEENVLQREELFSWDWWDARRALVGV
jgi:hypothetical protein